MLNRTHNSMVKGEIKLSIKYYFFGTALFYETPRKTHLYSFSPELPTYSNCAEDLGNDQSTLN